jgi:hypothetical protein
MSSIVAQQNPSRHQSAMSAHVPMKNSSGAPTTEPQILTRSLEQFDGTFLWDMLYEAGNVKEGGETIEGANQNPALCGKLETEIKLRYK